MARKLYCPSCGEDVDAFGMLVRGNEVLHCSQCGAHLVSMRQPVAIPPLEVVLIAQDSALLRGVLKEVIEEQGMARTAIACKDGHQLIVQFTERIKERSRVDLVILDFQMQVIDGRETARNIRLLEQTFLKSHKVPLLFFSSVKCDESIKKLLSEVQPAAFLYKKDDTSPLSIATRMKEVLSRIFGQERFVPTGHPSDGTRQSHPLTIRQEADGKVVTLVLEGDLTSQSEEDLFRAVNSSPQGFSTLIMDIGGVEHINSSGMAILIGLVKKAKASGFALAISGASEHHRKLFTMVGLAQYISLFPTLEAAQARAKSI